MGSTSVLMGTNLTRTKPWKALLYSPTDGMDRPPPDLDGLCEIGCLETCWKYAEKSGSITIHLMAARKTYGYRVT